MLKRLVALIAAVAVLAMAVLIGTAPPAAAAGNGIQIGQFAYVTESDPWLDDICNNDVEKPEFVVLNIGNGHTDDVGRLDVIGDECRDNGVKTLGYVHLVDSLDYDGDSNTTELRPRVGGSGGINLTDDLDHWINPFNAERTNAVQYLDGIFIDQVPNTCGASGVNTLAVADITDAVQDMFTFWSYGTALVMANVGTAVEDCMPGFAAFADMPDRWVTFEGSYSSYAGSYLGGNVYSSGPTYYNGENTFGQDAFVHIVYAADQAEMETALRYADNRGAAFAFVTDDVPANPYDTEPTYRTESVRWAATPHTIFDDGDEGWQFGYTGSPSLPWITQATIDSSGSDTPFVTRFIALIAQECFVDIMAGTSSSDPAGEVGSSTDTGVSYMGFWGWDVTYTALDSTFVDCVFEMFEEGPNPGDPSLKICNDLNLTANPDELTDYDCRNPDGSADVADENENEDATAMLLGQLSTPQDVSDLIVLVRDRNTENANDGSGMVNCLDNAGERCLEPPPPGSGQWRQPACIIARTDSLLPNAVGAKFGWTTSCGSFPNP
jgi:hypothetical protein